MTIVKISTIIFSFLIKLFPNYFAKHCLRQAKKKGNTRSLTGYIVCMLHNLNPNARFYVASREETIDFVLKNQTNAVQLPVSGDIDLIVEGKLIPPAMAYPMMDGPAMVFCPELMLESATKIAKLHHWNEKKEAKFFRSMIYHEFWHYCQYEFLFEKGGVGLVRRVSDYEIRCQYGEGPLEKGALHYGFSLGKERQNLNELLVA